MRSEKFSQLNKISPIDLFFALGSDPYRSAATHVVKRGALTLDADDRRVDSRSSD